MADGAGAILTLDGALAGCGAGVVRGGDVLAEQRLNGERGSSAALPAMAGAVMAAAGLQPGRLHGIMVTVGPGSFTGVRAALALGHGLAAGTGVPVWGVTVGAAIRAGLRCRRPLWVAVDSRRGRVFLDDGATVVSVALDALPPPTEPIAIAGDAAGAVLSRLAARGFDVQLLSVWWPAAAAIAAAAPGPALPLYIDPPQARPGPAARPVPA